MPAAIEDRSWRVGRRAWMHLDGGGGLEVGSLSHIRGVGVYVDASWSRCIRAVFVWLYGA